MFHHEFMEELPVELPARDMATQQRITQPRNHHRGLNWLQSEQLIDWLGEKNGSGAEPNGGVRASVCLLAVSRHVEPR